MNLNEATHILSSLGYNVEFDMDADIQKDIKFIKESMEKRRHTHNDSYRIISEMARFNGRYVGSFEGLENAGTVTLTVKGEDKEFGVAEALSKVENDFKSADSKGYSQSSAERLLANYDAALAAVPETANAEYIQELNKERTYIAQCIEEGDGIPKGGWTASSQARTTHSRDDSALTAKKLITNINNSITSLKKGGNNYDRIKARIDDLLARTDLTEEERETAEGLEVKLDIANRIGQNAAQAAGRTAVFSPNNKTRTLRRLRTEGIPFTENEDGTITITGKVTKAREELEGLGEFIETQVEVPAESNAITFTAGPDEMETILEDIVGEISLTATQNEDGSVTIDGTARQMKKFKKELEDSNIQIEIVTPSAEPETVEEPVEPVEVEEVVEDDAGAVDSDGLPPVEDNVEPTDDIAAEETADEIDPEEEIRESVMQRASNLLLF